MTFLASGLSTIANQDGAVILDIVRNQITTLNATGGFVWNRLRNGYTVAETVQDLAAETQSDAGVVEEGVLAFLEQLKAQHLLSERIE